MFEKTQREFSQHLREPDQPLSEVLQTIEPRRIKIYEDLIFKNIEGFISGGFPVLRQLYSDDDWASLVRNFIVKHECHSPYFLKISEEFLSYLQHEHVAESHDPAFMLELAHYEWVELALDVSEETLPVTGEELLTVDLLEGLPLSSPLAWTLSYQFPVHLIGPDYQPSSAPEQPTYLLVYRNRSDEVHFMESNALTVRLLQLLSIQEHASGRALLMQLGEESQFPDLEAFISMGCELLLKLQSRDIIF